jgi:hypothetical protein
MGFNSGFKRLSEVLAVFVLLTAGRNVSAAIQCKVNPILLVHGNTGQLYIVGSSM